MRKLSAHPAMTWDILGKVVESIEIGPPDDVVLVFEDGARLILSGASGNAELLPFRGPLAGQPTPMASAANQVSVTRRPRVLVSRQSRLKMPQCRSPGSTIRQ